MRDETLRLNSVVLRAVAEVAASQRLPHGDPGSMVTTRDPEGRFSIAFRRDPPSGATSTAAPGPGGEAEVVTPVNTFAVASRPRVDQITITADGVPIPNPDQFPRKYDALFWSEAAVEKFLFPYYASKGQWLAASILAELSTRFYGKVPTGDPAEQSAHGTNEPLPFALAHLPRSDYVGLDEMTALLADVETLTVIGGKVVARPLSDYLPKQART